MASSSSSPLIQVDRCQDGGLLPPNVCCCYCSVTVSYMFQLIRNYYTLFIMSIYIYIFNMYQIILLYIYILYIVYCYICCFVSTDQSKFLVCKNFLGNRSDSGSGSDIKCIIQTRQHKIYQQ